MVARTLQRAGQWDLALGQVPPGRAGAPLRAEILTERYLWQLDRRDEALACVKDIAAEEPALAAYLTAQLEYWRQLLALTGTAGADRDSVGTDPAGTFAELAGHPSLGPWAVFWRGVTLENLHADGAGAAACYAQARELAAAGTGLSGDGEHSARPPDRLLESYVTRHQGGQAFDAGDRDGALALARRSLHLRAALGARPQVAAAQAQLADMLGDVPEAAALRELVAATAAELRLAWLLPRD
jgi:hypothetical protein